MDFSLRAECAAIAAKELRLWSMAGLLEVKIIAQNCRMIECQWRR
jgi:hypothetical protein